MAARYNAPSLPGTFGDLAGSATAVASRSLRWVPVGFTAYVFLGDALSISLPYLLPALLVLAMIHGAAPSEVAVVVGAGGLLVILVKAAQGTAELGPAYPVVAGAYGGVMATVILVAVIGNDQPRRRRGTLPEHVALWLTVGVVAVELALFTLTPLAEAAFGPPQEPARQLLPVVVLVAATAVAIRYEVGLRAVAMILLVVLLLSAVAGTPYGHDAPTVLVGTLLFACIAALLATAGPIGWVREDWSRDGWSR